MRFTVQFLEDSFSNYGYSNNTNQTTEIALGIISTALLKSLEEENNATNSNPLINCMIVLR